MDQHLRNAHQIAKGFTDLLKSDIQSSIESYEVRTGFKIKRIKLVRDGDKLEVIVRIPYDPAESLAVINSDQW